MMEARRSTSSSEVRWPSLLLLATSLSAGCPAPGGETPDPTPEPTPRPPVGDPHDPGPPYFEEVTECGLTVASGQPALRMKPTERNIAGAADAALHRSGRTIEYAGGFFIS